MGSELFHVLISIIIQSNMLKFDFGLLLAIIICYCTEYTARSIDLEIVTPAYFGLDSLASTSYLQPAFTTGLAGLRRTYPQFNVSHRFLEDANTTTCPGQQATVQDILSRWYYQDLRNTSIPVILTAGCLEAEYVNQLAHSWNILMLTSIGADDTIRKKWRTPTWITNTPLPANYGELYKGVLSRYNWTSIVVIIDQTAPAFFQYLAKAVSARLKQEGFRLTTWNLSSAGKFKEEILLLLSGLREICRVVLYYGDADSLRRFLIAASDKNMTNGDYVYFAAQPFEHKLFGTFSWHSTKNVDEDMKVRLAYRSVLLLNVVYERQDAIDKVKDLLPIWQNLSKAGSLNATSIELPVPYLTATHTVFQILGLVMDKFQHTDNESDIRSGSLLASHFFNRTFASDTGPITINSVGVRLTAVSVKQFQNDSDELETFLTASENNDGSFTWQSVQSVSWFGSGEFPPNEPLCGYLGQSAVCQNNGRTLLEQALIGIALIAFLFGIIAAIFVRMHLKYVTLLTENGWKLDHLLLGSAPINVISTATLKQN